MKRFPLLFIAGLLGPLLLVVITQAQQVSSAPSPTEFIVLGTELVDVPFGDTVQLNCSVVGLGDAAELSCEPEIWGSHSGSGKVYHVALVVGSNHVGYVVYCITGGLLDIGCQPLSTGQVLKGSVQGDKLSVIVRTKTKTKTKNYTVETSAYIGPLTTRSPKSDSTASPPVEQPSTEPSVKLTIQKSGKSESAPGGQADQPGSPTNTAEVMISSEPPGADIYVDGNFVGNTPSQILLVAGTHTVRIEAKGQKPWSRTVTLTAGGKVTLRAVLNTQ